MQFVERGDARNVGNDIFRGTGMEKNDWFGTVRIKRGIKNQNTMY